MKTTAEYREEWSVSSFYLITFSNTILSEPFFSFAPLSCCTSRQINYKCFNSFTLFFFFIQLLNYELLCLWFFFYSVVVKATEQIKMKLKNCGTGELHTFMMHSKHIPCDNGTNIMTMHSERSNETLWRFIWAHSRFIYDVPVFSRRGGV